MVAKKTRKQKRTWLWFLLPSIAGVSVFTLIPFADVVRRSFYTAVSGTFVGAQNYNTVFHNEAFRLAIGNTGRFVLVCLPILLILSLYLAVLLSRRKDVQLLKSSFLLPLAVPSATVVFIWKMLFFPSGILNGWIERIGGTAIDFMGTDASFWVLVASYVWKNLGYTIVLWLAAILGVPENILEAARVDGASERQCFYKIILPHILPMMYTVVVLSFLNSFKVFREAYLVAGSYPQESMYLLQHLFNNWFVNLDLDKMAAGAVIIALIMLVGVLLLQFFLDRQEDA